MATLHSRVSNRWRKWQRGTKDQSKQWMCQQCRHFGQASLLRSGPQDLMLSMRQCLPVCECEAHVRRDDGLFGCSCACLALVVAWLLLLLPPIAACQVSRGIGQITHSRLSSGLLHDCVNPAHAPRLPNRANRVLERCKLCKSVLKPLCDSRRSQ